MPSSNPKPDQPSFWQRLGEILRGPMIGTVLAVLFVRLGYDERGESYYFTAREAQREEVRLGIHKPGHTSGDVRERLTQEEPKLASEPNIRVVKLYGLEIVTEYAGLGLSVRAGKTWNMYLLPSHWLWRLQCLFGAFGGLFGFAVAQQRAISELRRQMGRVHRTIFPVDTVQPDLTALFPNADRPRRAEETLPSNSPVSPS